MEYMVESLLNANKNNLILVKSEIDNYEVDLANKWVRAIQKTRSEQVPVTGDRIKFTDKFGQHYPNAHIERVMGDQVNICLIACAPFVALENGKIACRDAYGTIWRGTSAQKLKYIGMEKKRFSAMTKAGANGSSPFQFLANVSVWEYIEQDPAFEDYDLTGYIRYDFLKVSKEDSNGKKLPVRYESFFGCKNFTEEEFAKWIHLMRGIKSKEVGGNNDCVTVYAYEHHDCLIPEDSWAKLKSPIVSIGINGTIQVLAKAVHDDEKRQVVFYRYTNSPTILLKYL